MTSYINANLNCTAEKSEDTNYCASFQSGNTTLVVSSNIPCEIQSDNMVKPESRPWLIDTIPLSAELQEFTFDLCSKLDIGYALVLGVMYVESRFELNPAGNRKMIGVMQLNSKYVNSFCSQYGVKSANVPKDNITIGVNLLAYKIKEYGVVNGLMAYNLGDAGMRNRLEKGNLNTTYARAIIEKQKEYQLLLEENN